MCLRDHIEGRIIGVGGWEERGGRRDVEDSSSWYSPYLLVANGEKGGIVHLRGESGEVLQAVWGVTAQGG